MNDIEVTKRELLASITIIAIMMIFGFVVYGKIEAHQIEKNAEYYTAAKITDTDLFQYGMDTSVGNAFVQGDLLAVDSVTYTEIGGEYLYVEKVEEHYNMHTRTVTYKDSDGKEHTREEIYWSWDYAGSEEIHSQRIMFCGIEMDYSKIDVPSSDYIKTMMESGYVRFQYYGCKAKYTGTIYTNLRDGSLSNKSPFYVGKDIEKAVEILTAGFPASLFWILWILLTCGVVFCFVALDNDWLEDSNGESSNYKICSYKRNHRKGSGYKW